MSSFREQLAVRVGTLLNTGTPTGVPSAVRASIFSVDRATAPAIRYRIASDTCHPMFRQRPVPGKPLEEGPALLQLSTFPFVRMLELHVESVAYGTATISAEEATDPLTKWVEKALGSANWKDLGLACGLVGTTFEDAGEDASACKATAVYRIAYTTKAGDPEIRA